MQSLHLSQQRLHVRPRDGRAGAERILRERVPEQRVHAGAGGPGDRGEVVTAFEGVDEAALA